MIICQKCGSRDIIKNGFIRGQQRYQCRDCKYNFVLKDRRQSKETSILKAVNLLINALNGDSSYDLLSELLDRDRSLICRWNKESGIPEYRSGNECTYKIDYDQLDDYLSTKKPCFDPSKPVFISSGKLLNEKYSAVLIIQRKDIESESDVVQ